MRGYTEATRYAPKNFHFQTSFQKVFEKAFQVSNLKKHVRGSRVT